MTAGGRAGVREQEWQSSGDDKLTVLNNKMFF